MYALGAVRGAVLAGCWGCLSSRDVGWDREGAIYENLGARAGIEALECRDVADVPVSFPPRRRIRSAKDRLRMACREGAFQILCHMPRAP